MRKLHRALAFQAIGFVLFVAAVVWAGRSPAVQHALLRAQHKVGAMEEWGLVLYPLLFAVCNILLLPGGILAISSGLFFGLWWGFAITMIGNVVAAAASFLFSRWIGREWIEKRIARHPKLAALDKAIAREGWKIIFWSQLHPLFPTSLLNYVYGVTRIPFWRCMMWATLARAPSLFLYAYLGTLAQFSIKILQHKTQPARHEYVLWIGGLVLTGVVAFALGRIALRLLAEAERAAEAAETTVATAKKEPRLEHSTF
jgi:uncharacterized membrane protein YdjX (TVP38/TMEM64 family)